jgi:hypothetical protein
MDSPPECPFAFALLDGTANEPVAVAPTIDTPQSESIPPSGTTAEELQTTTDVSGADFVTGAPPSSSDPCSRGATYNVSRIPLVSVYPIFQPHLKPRTTGYRCLQPGLFPSRSSPTEYHWCRLVGNWFVHSKQMCPVGQRFNVLYRVCVPIRRLSALKLRPFLSYFNRKYGTGRRELLNDAVLRRIIVKEPWLGNGPNPINLPTHFLNERHKQYTV